VTVFGRILRYLSIWSRLHEISSLNLERQTIEELVDSIFQFGGGYFAPVQIKSEIVEALQEIRKLRPKYVVELGTAGAGTLLLWSRVADPAATIVTIDLPGGEFGGGSSYMRVPMFRRFALPGQILRIIRADSHNPQTLDLTKKYLGGNPADFLFIDADHTEAGVRADYRMYAPLVRHGGVVGFHDIAVPQYGVRTLWSELKARYPAREILGQPEAYGIGLLYL
jgi:predicted O-methyltransferase YrrM